MPSRQKLGINQNKMYQKMSICIRSYMQINLRKIQMIHVIENCLWKSNFGSFWRPVIMSILKIQQYGARTMDTQRELFFQKFETFGLGQTNWAEILWSIWGISGQTISTILAQWVPCPWERVGGSISYKKLPNAPKIRYWL